MRQENQVISKGTYEYSQISGFISVKDYIFARADGKKCLFIRFLNQSAHVITSMSFTIIQLNSSGEDIGQIRIECPSLNIAPEKSYAYDKAIVVNEYCSDFKIVFSETRSNDYIYQVHDGRVTTYYDLPSQHLINGPLAKKPITHSFSVKRKKFGKPRLAIFLAIVAILLILSFNLINILLA